MQIMRADKTTLLLQFLAVLVVGGVVSGVDSDTPPQGAPNTPTEQLPSGFVRGDVVSYSYVPIRRWSPKEGIGILPYLFEYNLHEQKDGTPLEAFHDENIRRIDIASQWSTVIMLSVRQDEYRDEIINLMLRAFRRRQLIVLSNYYGRRDKDGGPYNNVWHILEKLWQSRDQTLASPEGDRATGRQLINNLLAVKCGDEGEAGLGTKGLEQLFAEFDRVIRLRSIDGRQPFRHIRAWYNMIGYAALNYNGGYAATRQDVDLHRRVKLPANTQCIGVDVYHYWGHKWSPFDPADLSIPREKVRAHTNEWHRLRTRYYPQGLDVRVCKNADDPATWLPECWNDTHALMSGIELAGANDAMMWYIGVSGQLGGTPDCEPLTYTTPVETMEAYYDELKAGPWVALSWWVFGSWSGTCHGGLEYYDRTLKHYTPDHPEGIPYSDQMLDYWRDEYIRVKMKLFNDVVHNQFADLNGPLKLLAKEAAAVRPAEKPQVAEKLLPGFVRGDVTSYSYVPNKYWELQESFGICPYLFEYGLMKWQGDKPLEAFHAENVRRIDLAARWSTCIELYNRFDDYRDETINLMIRCFKNRQLIILCARPGEKEHKNAFRNFIDILDKLWENKDNTLENPEGDKATGRQLINNILAVNIGDEGLSILKTEGLENINRMIQQQVKGRLLDGQRPFAHIKTWYNEVHYGIGSYAANKEDLAGGRYKWPENSEFIGVDVYHYWSFQHVPFDPDNPDTERRLITQNALNWQNVITKYHGPDFKVALGEGWNPKYKNDTHAMLQAIRLAGADRAMMLFIANSSNLPDSYTTPIETMDAYYDAIKEGPWVALSWWVFDDNNNGQSNCTIDYLDKTLKRYAPDKPQGADYSDEKLEDYRARLIASRITMFNDVVYNQFAHLNGPTPEELRPISYQRNNRKN